MEDREAILTPTTKAALEQAEAERARLLQRVQGQQTKADTVAMFLPNAIRPFKAMLDDLVNVTQHQAAFTRWRTESIGI